MEAIELAKRFFFEGLTCFNEENYEAAETKFREALAHSPDRVSILTNLSATLLKLGKSNGSRDLALRAISLNPNTPEAWLTLGLIDHGSGNYPAAINCFDKSLRIAPDYAEAWANKGAVLHDMGQFDEALSSYEQAIAFNPDYADAWFNKGITCHAMRHYTEALACYRRVQEIRPAFPDAHWDESLTRLTLGDFAAGWDKYEYRWARKNHEPYRHADTPPLCALDDIQGKTVLIWSEQGLGDSIQFSRYIEALGAHGASVIFEVQKPLAGLMESLGNCKVVDQSEDIGQVDYQLPLLSLPRLFKTNEASIPGGVPYLKVDEFLARHWKQKLHASDSKPKVGIACSGNQTHINDSNRSITLEGFSALLQIGHLYVIQKEVRPSDQDFLMSHPEVSFVGSDIDDFRDTAAILENMDVIVSVDTSLVHLAGALAKPVFVLLPWNADWRWRSNGEKSAWYPTATLYRQSSRGDWDSVFAEVGRDLRILLQPSLRN